MLYIITNIDKNDNQLIYTRDKTSYGTNRKVKVMFQKIGRADSKKVAFAKRVSLTLFFCLFFTPAFAASPTVGTITPSSGSTAPNIARTFTCRYYDYDGWSNLKEAYLLINTSSTNLTNSVYLYYDQNTNLLYLRNEDNTTWLGGFAPGSSNTIENSFAIINCRLTSITGSTRTLSINWNITFKQAFSGKAYNTYLYAKDDAGGTAGWTKKGIYTINSPPQLGTITPSYGRGTVETTQIFTTTYSDADGWQNIQYAYFLMNTSTSGLNCPYGYYNQNTNLLYLRNDDGTNWLGGYAPGSDNSIENSYARLNCASTSVNGSGATLTINWSVVIKAPFTGSKKIYLYVKDDRNVYVNFTQKGTWSIPNQTPSVGIITPSSGVSSPEQIVNFTTTYSDLDTWLNIQYVYFLVTTTSSTRGNCLYAYYNQNTNRLYLRNNTNTSWLGGYIPGAAKVIENSYAQIYCAQTTISVSGNTLTVNWQVAFKSSFTGNKNIYLYVIDDANAFQGYIKKGSWNIQVQPIDTTPPQITNLTPRDGTGFYENVPILISPTVNDIDPSPLEYQFSVDGLIKQAWSGAPSYNWMAQVGRHTIKIEVRDTGGADSKEAEIFVFRNPLKPAQ